MPGGHLDQRETKTKAESGKGHAEQWRRGAGCVWHSKSMCTDPGMTLGHPLLSAAPCRHLHTHLPRAPPAPLTLRHSSFRSRESHSAFEATQVYTVWTECPHPPKSVCRSPPVRCDRLGGGPSGLDAVTRVKAQGWDSCPSRVTGEGPSSLGSAM